MLALVQLYSDLLPNLVLTFSAFGIKLSCKQKELEAILVFPKGETRPSPPCCGEKAGVASRREGQGALLGAWPALGASVWPGPFREAGLAVQLGPDSLPAAARGALDPGACRKPGLGSPALGKSWLILATCRPHSGPANVASDALGLAQGTARAAALATGRLRWALVPAKRIPSPSVCLYLAIERGTAKMKLQPPSSRAHATGVMGVVIQCTIHNAKPPPLA